MQEPDSSALLNQITQLIDSHEQSIQDSGNLVEALKLNLKTKLDSPSFQCGFDEEKYKRLNSKPPTIRFQSEKKTGTVSPEDRIYETLANRIKMIISSPDKTITASGPASELVKNLVDKFLSVMDNPTERSDSEIIKFVRSQEADINDFIENNCRHKMISCLNERIEEEKVKFNLIFASTVSSGPLMKVTDQVEPIQEVTLPVLENRLSGERGEIAPSALQSIYQDSTKEKKTPKIIDDNDMELQKSLQILNAEVESKYTELVIDQINGLKEISKKISSDGKRTDVFAKVKSKYEEEQNAIKERKKKLESPEHSVSGLVSKIDIKSHRFDDKPRSNAYSQLMDNLNKSQTKMMPENPSNSELVRALDAALVGLEKDIRARLFHPSRDSSQTFKHSIDNLTMTSYK